MNIYSTEKVGLPEQGRAFLCQVKRDGIYKTKALYAAYTCNACVEFFGTDVGSGTCPFTVDASEISHYIYTSDVDDYGPALDELRRLHKAKQLTDAYGAVAPEINPEPQLWKHGSSGGIISLPVTDESAEYFKRKISEPGYTPFQGTPNLNLPSCAEIPLTSKGLLPKGHVAPTPDGRPPCEEVSLPSPNLLPEGHLVASVQRPGKICKVPVAIELDDTATRNLTNPAKIRHW